MVKDNRQNTVVRDGTIDNLFDSQPNTSPLATRAQVTDTRQVTDVSQFPDGSKVRGRNPFDQQYRVIKILAQNENGRVEVVEDNIGDRYVRKMRQTQKGDTSFFDLAKLGEREFDFVTNSPHPAFAKMYGYAEGAVEGKLVFSSLKEYIEGMDLEKKIERGGPLAPTTAVDYMLEVLDVFSYVHEKGRLIRDFKPSNIMLQERARSNKIRFIDLDSMGKRKEIMGTSGSTMMVGSETWTHPYGLVSDLASIETDLFAVGTSFFYFLTGRKPEQTRTGSGGVTLTEENFSVLEEKISQLDGGAELSRTIHRLLDPIPERQYKSASDVAFDLNQIKTIFENGYQGLDNKKFQVYQESVLNKGKKLLYQGGSGLKELLFSTATRLTLTVGVLASLGLGWGSHAYLQHKSESRAVVYTPEISAEEHPMVQASGALSNTVEQIGALYVQLTGATPQKIPNDIVLQRMLNAEIKEVKNTKESLHKAKAAIDVYAEIMGNIYSGGERLRRSFVHTKHDEYHTEVYYEPVQSCTSDGKGGTSCTTTMEMRTRQVYDYTDHYWTFDVIQAREAIKELHPGVEGIKVKHPEAIDYRKLLRITAPETDALGRKILPADMTKYIEGQNEWLQKGLAPKYNTLANVEFLIGNLYVQNVLAQAANGFNEGEGYPNQVLVRNTCPSCDEDSAPSGYVKFKRVQETTFEYTKQFGNLQYIFRSSEPELDRLMTELHSIEGRLNGGEKIGADDLLKPADIATVAYKVMVPNSVIAAPTAGERKWWPIGLILGGLLITGIAGGVVAHNQNENEYRKRFRYY